MAIKKRTDQLPAIVSGDVDNNDLMYLVHENAQAETGYDSKKILVSDVGRKLNNGIEYATELPSFPSGSQNPLDALELLKQEILDLYPVDSASGSLANFNTSLALPLVSLKTEIKATGGGGTPTTPIPVVGASEVNVYRRGVNLSDEVWELGVISSTTGTNVNDNTHIRTKNLTPIKPNTSYYVYIPNPYFIRVYWYDKNEDFISAPTASQKGAYTSPANAYFMRLVSWDTSYGTTYNHDISINYPSTDTQYHAYNPNSEVFTLPLGQTVYGGYVDWELGKLVVTWGSSKISDIEWGYASGAQSTSGKIFKSTSGVAKPRERYNPNNILCSIFTTDTNDWFVSNIDNYNMMIDGSGYLYIRDDDYDNDVTGFVNALGDTVLCFEIPTPIEISLPTTMPQTIQGVQNWFADSGDIELEYKMGVQEYIDKKIAEVQALVL